MEPNLSPSTNNKQFPNKSPCSKSSKILVCRGRSCRKYNSERVFAKFKQNLPADFELISVGCLGQCGNGSMVFIETDQTWYSQVHPDEVPIIIKKHLIEKSPVKAMLYPKFHSQE